MPKHFSHLKNMTTHQQDSSEGKDLTTFKHYVGGLGKGPTEDIANRDEDNYGKTKRSNGRNY